MLFYGSHLALFTYGWYSQASNARLAGLNTLRWSVWISRGAGLVLAYDGGLILLPVLRNIIKILRPGLTWLVQLDENIRFHRQVAYQLLFWTIVHTTAHYVNFINVERTQLRKIAAWQIHYTQAGGITGHVMLLIMLLMYTTAHAKIRAQCFEAFCRAAADAGVWALGRVNRYTHHLAFFFMLALYTHATGCFVRDSVDPDYVVYFPFYSTEHCLGYNSWRFIIVRPFFMGEAWWGKGVMGTEQRKVAWDPVFRGARLARGPRAQGDADLERPSTSVRRDGDPVRQAELQVQERPVAVLAGSERVEVAVASFYYYLRPRRPIRFRAHPPSGRFHLCPRPPAGRIQVDRRGAEQGRPGRRGRRRREAAGRCQRLLRGRPRDEDACASDRRALWSAGGDVFNYEVAVLVGAGIGVTPFASILKNIWYKQKKGRLGALKRVEFIWVCRDTGSFHWFQSLLAAVESQQADPNFLRINMYLTQKIGQDMVYNIAFNDVGANYDPLTALKSRTLYGRPDWKGIYTNLRGAIEGGSGYLPGRESSLKTRVATFFCGPSGLGKVVHKTIKSMGTKQTEFSFHKEHF